MPNDSSSKHSLSLANPEWRYTLLWNCILESMRSTGMVPSNTNWIQHSLRGNASSIAFMSAHWQVQNLEETLCGLIWHHLSATWCFLLAMTACKRGISHSNCNPLHPWAMMNPCTELTDHWHQLYACQKSSMVSVIYQELRLLNYFFRWQWTVDQLSLRDQRLRSIPHKAL